MFTCHVSCVTCHMSRVRCHKSHVTRHNNFFFFGQSGESYWWRVCYQRGLPRLVSLYTWFLYKLHYMITVYQSTFQSIGFWANAFYKSKCPSVCLSVCVAVCLSVCMFTFEVPFNGLFAPTSRSRMSNIF